eukprot:439312-Prymnesium_polylepis.1
MLCAFRACPEACGSTLSALPTHGKILGAHDLEGPLRLPANCLSRRQHLLQRPADYLGRATRP